MKKILIITGAAGFIGSKISNSIDFSKYEVFGVDDFSNGYKSNVEKNIEFIKLDLSKKKNFNLLPKKPDFIMHLAGQSSAEKSFYNPNNDFKRNFLTTYNLINYFKNKSLKHFIYASSAAVYGNFNKKLKATETTKCFPLSYYGHHKLLSEKFIQNQNKVPYTIFRLSNVYGPGQNMTDLKQGMVSIYLAQMLKNNHIIVKGSTERNRDFIYIDDVVKIWKKSMNDRRFKNKVINIGSGKRTSVSNLLNIIIKLGKDVKVDIRKSTPDDQLSISPNVSLLKKLFKFKNTSLNEGIKKFYEYSFNQ